MKQIEYARQSAILRPEAPASLMTNAELYEILKELADLREAMEILITVQEPHPVEEAVEIEQAIDAQLPYTRVFNPYLNGSIRYCSELDERKAQADAICEEYEAQDADWRAQVTELRGGL